MKFSVTVTPIQPKFAPLVFTNGIAEHLPLIADLGYDAIELHIANPAQIDRKALRRDLYAHGLTISQLGPGLAFGQEGLCWAHADPEIRKAAIQRIKDHIDLASEYGAAIAIGLIRGQFINADPAKAPTLRQLVADAYAECARYAEGKGVTLAVEPINRYEVDYINNVDDALEFIEQVNSSVSGILADTFHMNIEEVSITESLKRAGRHLTIIHLSDSNRWAPGFGHLDFQSIIRTLKEMGYNGYISFEVLPKPSPEEAARQGITYVKSLLNNL